VPFIQTQPLSHTFTNHLTPRNRLFHGNTCVHEMNVSSTATVLQLVPSDINDLLNVVFVGPRKFKPEYLGNMYQIRKSKVWQFLQWLEVHNRLYTNISLDESVMVLYPEDGYLPGIEDGVICDRESDAAEIFREETAAMSEHPAELLGSSSNTLGSEPFGVILEKMGVTDPECDRMPGQLFTAAALRNLVPENLELPGLVLHRAVRGDARIRQPQSYTWNLSDLGSHGDWGFWGSDIPLSFQIVHLRPHRRMMIP